MGQQGLNIKPQKIASECAKKKKMLSEVNKDGKRRNISKECLLLCLQHDKSVLPE